MAVMCIGMHRDGYIDIYTETQFDVCADKRLHLSEIGHVCLHMAMLIFFYHSAGTSMAHVHTPYTSSNVYLLMTKS